jgi:hypothetical protein
LYVDELLDPLRVKAVEFRRSEEYASVENELESTARYFKSPRYNYPDINLDDVWFLVGDIFRHSRLTPFNHIIHMWEKKYNLGAFMRDESKPFSKARRGKFINSIGYANFKILWRKTFEVASALTPVSAITVKGEALPVRKYLEDKVRTVVGSPISQYILSTIWNYAPNHHFDWLHTPIKVGIPTNGYWLSDLYARHARCTVHYAGDMTAFDSTVSGGVLDIIKAVRKAGFKYHKDYDKIAQLIDANYEQVKFQLLNFTSTGDIYKKGTGLTTGHSSTSMDNSLALVIIYFMAWHDLTGLNARDFKFYNELSCFGDDHLLSTMPGCPASWNFDNIILSMKKFGITMRREGSGKLTDLTFLSKHARVPTPGDLLDFVNAKIDAVPTFVISHDRERLLGKLLAKVKTMDPGYRVKRLLSYLDLTAHHPDVYNKIVKVIKTSSTLNRVVTNNRLHIKTYDEVIANWYNPKANIRTNPLDEAITETDREDNLEVYHYGDVSLFDSLLSGIAMLPDIVNPAIFNFGYTKLLQVRCANLMSWPLDLLQTQNHVITPAELASLSRKTVYSFLDPFIRTDNAIHVNISTLLVRHWVFLSCMQLFKPKMRFTHSILANFSRAMSTVQFGVNGKMHDDMTRLSLPYLEIGLVICCGFIHVPDFVPWVANIELPNVSHWVDSLFNYILTSFWASIPPNYKDLLKELRAQQQTERSLVVCAPTGTGKSTQMVRFLNENIKHMWKKIIVVEPRRLLVKSIVPYMQQVLGVDVSGLTTGVELDQRAPVWYMTAQELLAHPAWLAPDYLIVVDECHVQEPAYLLLTSLLKDRKVGCVFTSATPPGHLKDWTISINLTTASLWAVNVSNIVNGDLSSLGSALNNYQDNVVNCINALPGVAHCLVFVQTIAIAKSMAPRLKGKVGILSSHSKLMDFSQFNVILATSVADVGITLPNVDHVFTSNIGFTVQDEGSIEGPTQMYFEESDDNITQRIGRTGRTNNGVALVFKYPALNLEPLSVKLQSTSSIMNLLSSGTPGELMNEKCAIGLAKLLGIDPDLAKAHPHDFDDLLHQLWSYRDNLSPLLRARLLDLDVEMPNLDNPANIDAARMGLFRQSSKLDSRSLIKAVVDTVALLHQLRVQGTVEDAMISKLSKASEPLLTNLQTHEPFPDPELREFGFSWLGVDVNYEDLTPVYESDF